jgi:putative oxidoreductase
MCVTINTNISEAQMNLFSDPYQLNPWGIFILRLGVGVVFVLHGYSKRKFWAMQPSEQLSPGMLSILRLLSVVEPLGGAALIIGFLTWWASLGLAIIMGGAIRLKGIKMHKNFTDQGGWGYDYILLAASIALMLIGPGPLTVEHLF